MKFAVLDYSYGARSQNAEESVYINIGDNIQSLAVEHLYTTLGVPYSDIVRIATHEVSTYQGEPVMLPLNMFGSKDDIFPCSPMIRPVFIGFNYVSGRCSDYADYFDCYSPVACRDEYTLDVMKKAGVDAYLFGCLSLCFPRRAPKVGRTKVFMVDVPGTLHEHVPTRLMLDLEIITHEVEVKGAFVNEQSINAVHSYAKQMLQRYSDEAALVVTGRLHCAAPCIALGVPVILVKENVDINLSWIDRFVRIYTEDEFAEIDWQPSAANVELIKEKMIGVFSSAMGFSSPVCKRQEIHDFFMDRVRANYCNLLNSQLDLFEEGFKGGGLDYHIWGAGAGGTLAYLLINRRFPGSRLVSVVDTYEHGNFFDMSISKPNVLHLELNEFLFICTYTGLQDALVKARELGLVEGKSYQVFFSRVINVSSEARSNVQRNLKLPSVQKKLL